MAIVFSILVIFAFGSFLMYDRLTNKAVPIENTKKDTPKLNLHLVKEGEYIKVKGNVLEQSTSLIAPISGIACVAFKVHITVDPHLKNLIEQAKTIYDATDFCIQTEKEKVVVLVKGADIQLRTKSKIFLGGDLELFPRIKNFLQLNGFPLSNFHDSPHIFELIETRLEFGENVSVMGNCFQGPEGPILEEGKRPLSIAAQ